MLPKPRLSKPMSATLRGQLNWTGPIANISEIIFTNLPKTFKVDFGEIKVYFGGNKTYFGDSVYFRRFLKIVEFCMFASACFGGFSNSLGRGGGGGSNKIEKS